MSNWVEGNLNTNGINVHYHRTGAPGKPALLLLHGVTDSGRVWVRVAHELEDEYDIVMTDARGHGQSDDLSGGFSLSMLADDAAGVIAGLGLQKPYVWGHSMGAITAVMLAANYPELVRAAVLEDPPLMTPEAAAALAEAAEDQAQSYPDFRAMSVEQRLATAKTMNPNWHPDELPPWAESKAQFDPAINQYIWSIMDNHWDEVMERIECPTLLVTGNPAAGAIVTPEVAQDATRLLKKGQVVQITGSGHSVHRDAYEPTMQAVREFLRTH